MVTSLAHAPPVETRLRAAQESFVSMSEPTRALVVAADEGDARGAARLLEGVGIETRRALEWSGGTREQLGDWEPDLVVMVGQTPRRPPPVESSGVPILWLPELPTHTRGASDRQAVVALRMGALATCRWRLADDEPPPPPHREPLHLDVTHGKLHKGVEGVRVTPAECHLLRVLLASRGQWLSSHELKRRAFGPEHRSQDSLLRVHVHKLRRKLDEISVRIESIRGRGYRLL
jgi:hypothetical protein